MDVPHSPDAAPKDDIASSRKVPTQNLPDTPRPKESLPRASVLRLRHRFQSLFETGRRTGNRYLTLLLIPAKRTEPGKVAIITPKKLGKAVVRNLLRRQLREIYRRKHPQLAVQLNSDLVIMAKSEALKLDFSSLERNFSEIHAKLVENHDAP